MGRLTRDPEVRYTTTGKVCTQFTLAVNRGTKDADGNYLADFVPVVAWGKTAEICGDKLAKGRRAAVEGRLQIRSYEDKNGQKHYTHEITVFSVGTRVYKNGIALLNHAEKQRANSQQGGYDQYQGASTQPGTGNFERFGEPAGPQYEEEEIPF